MVHLVRQVEDRDNLDDRVVDPYSFLSFSDHSKPYSASFTNHRSFEGRHHGLLLLMDLHPLVVLQPYSDSSAP